jgi:hypothetical protein
MVISVEVLFVLLSSLFYCDSIGESKKEPTTVPSKIEPVTYFIVKIRIFCQNGNFQTSCLLMRTP